MPLSARMPSNPPRTLPNSLANGSSADDAGDEYVQAEELTALLRRCGAGDQEAWRGIVNLYARRVYALARSRLVSGGGQGVGSLDRGQGQVRGAMEGSSDLAEEITQSVFVTVASKLSSGDYTEQGRFESWLFRVAMNRVRDEVRRVKRHATPTDPETMAERVSGDASPVMEADERSRQEATVGLLREAMEQLSESDREIVELRHHAGLSFKQIADLLSEPMGTLLARHHRALKKLKDCMQERNPHFNASNVSGEALS